MPLEQNQQNKLNSWLTSKKANMTCPVCGQNKWSTGDIIASPTMFNKNINIGGPTVPMLQLACNNCGYIRLFASIAIGL